MAARIRTRTSFAAGFRRHLLLLGGFGLLLYGCRSTTPPVANNSGLQTLYEQDQADRRATTWGAAVDQRDAQRRQQVRGLLAQRQVRTAADHYHAALVLQHGSDSADYRLARQLALRAEALGEPRAPWLAAAALDRYLLSRGQAQRYGTQFEEVDGRTYLSQLDSMLVTDAERRRVGVPTLDSLRAYLRHRNGAATASLGPPPARSPAPMVELVGGLEALVQQARYPAEARAARVEGTVRVQVEVQPDGSAGEAVVIDGPDHGLHAEALRLVRQARYINRANEPWEIRLLIPFKL